MLTGEQVAAHGSKDDLWMIISGKVYDLTEFAPNHPGGMKILLKYAGKDATSEYDPIHPPGTIESSLPADKHLGPVDMTTVAPEDIETVKEGELGGRAAPTLEGCLNLRDFEDAAEVLLKPKAWAYYASAADDELTKEWNASSMDLIRLRPRVLRDISAPIDLTTSMLGRPCSLPIFIAPAAMGRLAHPDGEYLLARVAKETGIPYVVSGNASIGFEDLAAEAGDKSLMFYQLYVNRDRAKTEEQLRKVVKAGYAGICVTVDAPVAGKRERDERSKLDPASASDPSMRDSVAVAPPSLAAAMFSYVDASLSWDDLAWVRKVTNLPIMVKGIQTAEDARICADVGVEAVYLSNHGGRQLEGAPSSLETLLEIRKYEPEVLKKCQVYVDGGFKRGTDVLKALALGATAVGIGRPFMCSLAFGYGGVSKVVQIMTNELEQNLRLLGGTKLSDLSPQMLNTRLLDNHIYNGPYESPAALKLKSKL